MKKNKFESYILKNNNSLKDSTFRFDELRFQNNQEKYNKLDHYFY